MSKFDDSPFGKHFRFLSQFRKMKHDPNTDWSVFGDIGAEPVWVEYKTVPDRWDVGCMEFMLEIISAIHFNPEAYSNFTEIVQKIHDMWEEEE